MLHARYINHYFACLIQVLKLDLLSRLYDFGIKVLQLAYTDGSFEFFSDILHDANLFFAVFQSSIYRNLKAFFQQQFQSLMTAQNLNVENHWAQNQKKFTL